MVTWKSRFAVPAALMLVASLPASALAGASEEIEHLKRENAQMKEMLMQMQRQLQDVMMKTNAMERQARKAAEVEGEKKGGTVASKKEDITISTTGGGIKVKSSNGNEFKIGGRLMFDFDSYDEFWAEESAEENEIRRSRFTLSGKVGKNWSYKFTTNIDHEDDEASVDTGFLKYSSKPVYMRLGKYKRPGMLEMRTSSKWISTIERSIVGELASATIGKPAFGGIEIGYASKGDMPVSGALGVYDNEIDETDGGDVYGVGGRLSIMPKFGDDSFLHAGASFYNADYNGANHRMRTRMGVHTTGRPFETDNHTSDDVTQFGVELAYVNGPFSLQGEFMNVESDGTDNNKCAAAGEYTPGVVAVDEKIVNSAYLTDANGHKIQAANVFADLTAEQLKKSDGTSYDGLQAKLNDLYDGDTKTFPGYTVVNEHKKKAKMAMYKDMYKNTCDLEMDGFYVQAAYTLTGETRGYKSGSGAFAAIKPKNQGGAWELVARYEDSEVDIPGRSLSAELERMVLGVNWYVNKNVKFMMNYVDSEMDGCDGGTKMYTADEGVTVPTDHGMKHKFKKCSENDGDAVSLRGQYVF